MKRLIACVSLVAVATTATVAAAPSKPAPKTTAAKPKVAATTKCRVAPADEYFGKLKMSILGIRNTIKDQGLKVDVFPEKAESTLGAMALTEDAVHDWQRKYPCDSWLPGSIYGLEHFYTKIHTGEGVKHVHATFAWLKHDFPRHRLIVAGLKEDGEAAGPSPAPPIAVDSGASPSPSPITAH